MTKKMGQNYYPITMLNFSTSPNFGVFSRQNEIVENENWKLGKPVAGVIFDPVALKYRHVSHKALNQKIPRTAV